MTTIYLVVEGNSDKAILSRVLSTPENTQLKFFVSEGFSNALSMVKTIFDLRPLDKIILIVDNDTLHGHNEFMFNAQLNTHIYSRLDSDLFRLFEMTPNIEGELFDGVTNQNIIQGVIENSLAELQEKPIIKKIQTFINAPIDSNEEEDLVLPRRQ